MDPRHPELAVSRIKELIAQYDRIEKDITNTTVANKLGQLERGWACYPRDLSCCSPSP